VELVDCTHFTTNVLKVEGTYERDLSWLQSFVIYICTEGEGELIYSGGSVKIAEGDVYLMPAIEQTAKFKGNLTVLESYC
jgi:mannose-6-phosphate isomerase